MGVAMSGAPSDSYLGGLFRTSSAGNIARKAAHRRPVHIVSPKPARPPKPRRQASPKRDEFAELLSQDLSIAEIGDRMGLTPKAAQRQFETICKRLGPQAI